MKQTMDNDKLPELRSELALLPGGLDFNHCPTWLIHDPLNNRYFHIGWLEYQIYLRWHLGSVKAIVDAVNQETVIDIDESDVVSLLRFFNHNCLIKQSHHQIRQLAKLSSQPGQRNFWSWLIRNYIFFRIPLVHPDKFLNKTGPYVTWIFSRTVIWLMALLAILALYLITRQWDTFFTTFTNFFSWEGLIFIAVVIFFSKLIHELGHAYRCYSYGLKVPSMGLAFMLLWPLFFTDTSESWRLNNKRRFAVGFAGIQMELYLATLGLLLWSFLPDGYLRSAAFYLASVNLITSLLINLSPFMRFDGYHLLSDLLGIRNLRPRAFQYTKWWLRKLLFGLQLPAPEALSAAQQRIFIIYSLAAWIYLLLLFVTIALLIYHFFFKALGIVLFILEIFVIILWPIVKEIKVWWQLRGKMTINKHSIITLSVLAALVVIFFVPWHGSMQIPATMSYQTQFIYAPEGAQVKAIHYQPGNNVTKDALLIQLYSPEIEYNIAVATVKIQQYEASLRSLISTQKDLENQHVIMEKLAHAKVELAGYLEQQKKLSVTAPFNGILESISKNLQVGMWVEKDQMLMILSDPEHVYIQAYVKSKKLKKIVDNQSGTFIADDLAVPVIPVRIVDIDYQQSRKWSLKEEYQLYNFLQPNVYPALNTYQASYLDGRVAVRLDKQSNFVPEQSVHRIVLIPDESVVTNHVERGIVKLEVTPESFAKDFWNNVVSVLIRESGF